jgi:glutaredoxin
MKRITIILFFWCIAFVAQGIATNIAEAKLYTWTDRSGKIRRTYYPPPADQVQKKGRSQQIRASKHAVRQHQVEIYTTSWCPYCKKAINFFKSQGISYTVYDIEKDRQAAVRKQKLDSRKGVPFVVVNGKKIHGYAPEAYKAALQQ